MKSDPRLTAINILLSLESGKHTLDDLVNTTLTRQTLPGKRDRALATALLFGVLRRRLTLDWIIRQLSTTPFEKIEPVVRAILRTGLYQIMFMDRIPHYAAVDSSVNQVKTMANPRLANFVNGVLRTAIRRRDELVFPDPSTDPVGWLSVTRSFPEWMIHRWLNRFGRMDTVRLCDMINRVPPITARVNTLKTVYARVRESLGRETERIEEGRFAPHAISFYSPRGSVDELEGFTNGWIQVQDEAAQLVCLMLDPQPGERVLDACAGLGGKTGYMGQLMENRGRVLATDSDGGKLRLLTGEMNRLGVSIVETRQVDWLKAASGRLTEKFDRVMADCPCSGMGVLRRNPDIKWSASVQGLLRHQKNQVRLLTRLADNVRNGGFLVYVVCSTEPEENEQVVDRFLDKRRDFYLDKQYKGPVKHLRRFISDRGYFQTSVYPHDLDGFFGVRLKKKQS